MSTRAGRTDLTHSGLKIGAVLPSTVIMATIISDPEVAASGELAALRARVDALESQARDRREPEGLSLLVFSGELDKLLAAFTMAAGAAANLSANPFASMTTVTYQIVQLLTGEGSFDHPATLAAFALGLVLFIVTLVLNIIALRVVKRFREAYE